MIVAIIQARMTSTRLPGKVLKPILNQPMLMRQVERVKRAKLIDKLLVATSSDTTDDEIEQVCLAGDITCYRGDLNDVLDRFYQAAKSVQAEHLVRLTGDNPLIDPALIDQVISFHLSGGFDYTSNTIEPTFPDGLDVEVVCFSCLETAWKEAELPSQREHVTPFIYTQPGRFMIGSFKGQKDLSDLRWTVDQPMDFSLVKEIYEALYPANPYFQIDDIMALLEARPELNKINAGFRNAGFARSLVEDQIYMERQRKIEQMSKRYRRSMELHQRALQVIPLGTQTFSKSKTQFPPGISPFYIERGRGCRVWDVDGNEYVDFINSLAAVTLGYNDPDVNAAVLSQLQDGIIFSLPHPVEIEVSEKIIDMVPCAEAVRFGKNGSDATSGAIRLARAFTGRDHIAVCGYHGWQDWYIASTTRNLGVPRATCSLTHKFIYNDLDSLYQIFRDWNGQVAAVIMEPMNLAEPKDGFLDHVRELASKNGTVLIFDETITGFRYANGGAQQYFGVTPDLATFGKGLANGYPVSALTGRQEIMRLMEEIFFSFTFGGEALSLAAALATLTKLQDSPILEKMKLQGQKLLAGLNELIDRHGVGHIVSTAGHPTWSFLIMKDVAEYSQWQIKTLFLQEMFSRGILTLGTHNISYAHGDNDLRELLQAYDQVLPVLKNAVDNRLLDQLLCCEPLTPLFKVR